MSEFTFLKKNSLNTKDFGIGVVFLQIHEHSSNSLPSVLGVKCIKEVIKMSVVLLTSFVMKNLKSFSMICESPNQM